MTKQNLARTLVWSFCFPSAHSLSSSRNNLSRSLATSKRQSESDLVDTNSSTSKRARVDITDLLGDEVEQCPAARAPCGENELHGNDHNDVIAMQRQDLSNEVDKTAANGQTHITNSSLQRRGTEREDDNVVYLAMHRETRREETDETVMGFYRSMRKANQLIMKEFMQWSE